MGQKGRGGYIHTMSLSSFRFGILDDDIEKAKQTKNSTHFTLGDENIVVVARNTTKLMFCDSHLYLKQISSKNLV